MIFQLLRRRAVWLLLTCCAWTCAAHAADTPASTPVAADMERRIAACITCHGRDGQASRTGYYPRLAGKPAGYLYEQLRSFRDGRRHQGDMGYLLANLPDAYLREMAQYFAARELPYAPPAPSELTVAELARGQALALHGDASRGIPACVACHGEALTGTLPGVPGLVGLPRLYVASQLGAWLIGERRALAPDCMAEVGRKLIAADIQAVAGWLATQPVPANPKAVAAERPMPMACSAAIGAQR